MQTTEILAITLTKNNNIHTAAKSTRSTKIYHMNCNKTTTTNALVIIDMQSLQKLIQRKTI